MRWNTEIWKTVQTLTRTEKQKPKKLLFPGSLVSKQSKKKKRDRLDIGVKDYKKYFFNWYVCANIK